MTALRIAVVGHVEHVILGRSDGLLVPGDIVHLRDARFLPGGGGGVAFAQLCRSDAEIHLFTALGNDDAGRAGPRGFDSLFFRRTAPIRQKTSLACRSARGPFDLWRTARQRPPAARSEGDPMNDQSPQRASTVAYAPPPPTPPPTPPTPARDDSTLANSATQIAPSTATGSYGFSPPASAARTTVLPKVDSDGTTVHLTLEHQGRYEPTKLLGVGGMGEVVLVRDHDIARPVALKRLLPEMNDPAILARFVDEIRTVGRLEHPNIVPIHDVGIDELGRYFFVMKYVEGETVESIIAKLVAGDPAYVAKYSIEVRIELFLGVMHALEYAHAQGVVHRDIKPANIMVGRFGEVVLMDWGIAKPLDATRDAAAGADGEIAATDEGPRKRMYATRVGSLIGTPMYMSPEQARGDNASLDGRSDIYSAMVLFHELIGLRHYLDDSADMPALLARIGTEEFGFFKLLGLSYPNGAPPGELIHFLIHGLAKDPAKRFQSAGEVIAGLHAILEGKVRVQCHITLTKRTFREMGRLVDRRPWVAFAAMIGLAAAVVFSLAQLVRMAIA